jgi:hypothetical protein
VTTIWLMPLVLSFGWAPAPARVVKGMDGQANLKLDVGRSLRGVPLQRQPKPDRHSPDWLSAIEKARLDGKRVLVASHLPLDQKLSRLVEITKNRFPFTEAAEERVEKMASQESSAGLAQLSAHAAKKAGVCRDRAFLMQTMLSENGIDAKVRYGVLYGKKSAKGKFNYLDGHAWVEAKVEGKKLLIDPSVPDPVQAVHIQSTKEEIGGKTRSVAARAMGQFLYLPTRDLRFVKQAPDKE